MEAMRGRTGDVRGRRLGRAEARGRLREDAGVRGLRREDADVRAVDPSRVFRDEQGFTSLSMALSLLLTIALVFTSAQVYRINSLASETQNVADAAALAALDEVAEFMVVVRVCDAVVLSMSLTSIVATAVGVVALCVPGAQAAGEALIDAGKEVSSARDTFATDAAKALNSLQEALPYLAAANAAAVAAANDRDDSTYVAIAVLAPSEGETISVGSASAVEDLQDAVDAQADEVEQAADEAEEAAEAANEAKEQGYLYDCGNNPSYCMYERASKLAGLSVASNPLYTSVDAWSFSVALSRAQAYYAARLANEAPEDDSVEEEVLSALRMRFYAYAVEQLSEGYVTETSDSFEAYFPSLPGNTAEMRETSLYTEAVYPVTTAEDGTKTMHAYGACPAIEGQTTLGSIEEMESGGYATCETCGFKASSLGKVAAASSSISNGFEYHYKKVAAAAEDYQQARAELDAITSEVKTQVTGLLEQAKEALSEVGGMRIDASPPGGDGCMAIVVNTGSTDADEGFESSFVGDAGTLGARVAVSAATLVEEPADEGESVVSSLLDDVVDDTGVAGQMAGVVLDIWSGALTVYAQGQEGLVEAVSSALDALPLISASGLGTWAADALTELVEGVGLEPADLDALKPLLVNSAHVAQADDGDFAAQLLSVKQTAVAAGDAEGALGSLASTLGSQLFGVSVSGSSVTIASVELYDGGPEIELTFALPSAVSEAAEGLIDEALESLGGLVSQVTGVTIWQ